MGIKSTCGKLPFMLIHSRSPSPALRASMQSAANDRFPPFVARGANANLEITFTCGDFDAVKHAEGSL